MAVIRKYFIFVQLVLANLSTFTHDVKGLHAAAREFSKLFKHRIQDPALTAPIRS